MYPHEPIQLADVKKLVGKQVYALKKDGTVASGKLVKISGKRLYLSQTKGKKAKTKAIAPLVLFDLLAIGTSPYAYGGLGYGFGGYPYGGGFGYPYGGGFFPFI